MLADWFGSSLSGVVGGADGSRNNKVSFSEVVSFVGTAHNNVDGHVVEIGGKNVVQGHRHASCRGAVVVPHVQIVLLVAPRRRARWWIAKLSVRLECVRGCKLELPTVAGHLHGRCHHDDIMTSGLEVSVESSDISSSPTVVVGQENVLCRASNQGGCDGE
ncbi:hypothetical protein OGATHE_001306 [Ogataea polymorpha]|uniref:Uncharacterized protein n=1 Tax=Ogataea polymorpha TaxID=460523 RepID=A0A9P8TFC5_9ASCO|nr:hypothetical protein OGATHE_001306 [Ogataea polymorpha]